MTRPHRQEPHARSRAVVARGLAQQLALGLQIQRDVDRGRYANLVEAANALSLTPSRVTQLVDLTFLAPDIQEEILCGAESLAPGGLTERSVRALLRTDVWDEQRAGWRALCAARR